MKHFLKKEESAGRQKPKAERKPTPDLQSSEQFKKWLNIFFVEKGFYKITSKGMDKFKPAEARQSMEFAENYSSREREDRIEGRYVLTGNALERAVKVPIDKLIAQGKAEELLENGLIIKSKASWANEAITRTVLVKFVETIGKPPKEIIQNDFYNNSLSGLLTYTFHNSPYEALSFSGHAYTIEETIRHAQSNNFQTEKIYPWEMKMSPYIVVRDKEITKAAINWLIWKTKKPPKEIIVDDFYNNSLSGLLTDTFHNSPYEALYFAGLITPADEAYMRKPGPKAGS